MALIEYKMKQQNFSASGAEAGKLHSQTFFECKLTAQGTDESIVLPVQTCTTIEEIKGVLVVKLGDINPDIISFVVKQGCSFRRMLNNEQVLRSMTVCGIRSFKVQLHEYPHPFGIIGAGYNGIKMALFLEKDNQKDYVIFDRYDRVGGHCWLECANKTTRLQTEFSAYHVWYGSEWSTPEHTRCGGAPKDWEIWPTADRVLHHFQMCAEEFGILPHVRFSTDVETTDLIGKITDPNRYYNFQCVPKTFIRKTTQGGGASEHMIGATEVEQGINSLGYTAAFKRDPLREPYTFSCSCFVLWPGNLINPRQLIYKGEEQFGGLIDYGVEMRMDYNECTGKRCIIHGHGAFAMENIRTLCEYNATHVDVLCRKRNLTCPRVVSWFINSSNPPISAVQCLNQLKVSYMPYAKYDPWDMHSVTTNASRTHATFNQKTRFGIGDIYFLGQAYGIVEIVVDQVKRLTHKTVHLESGRKLENIDCIVKCVGMLPDWTVEKVLKSKFLRGYWINGDVRRFTCADPDGIAASNFAATTIGPGSYGWVKMVKHFWDMPSDWARLENEGTISMIPIHNSGDPDPDTPAYFIDARHSTQTSMTINSLCPVLAEKQIGDSAYKQWVVLYCTPPEKFLEAAKQEWVNYENMFREKGMCPKDAPYVEYPYTLEWIADERIVHQKEMEWKGSLAANK